MSRFIEGDRHLPHDSGGSERRSPSPNLGIYDESHRLTSAAVWGPVGAEALIAQLLPTTKSLFLARMDVLQAREEGIGFNNALNASGVNTTIIRDELAKVLPVDGLTLDGVRSGILTKARAITETHREELQREIDKAKSRNNPNGRQEIWPTGIERDLDSLLMADIFRYGEPRALALNKALVLDPDIPMGDAIYARDQMNVLLGRRVQSRMTFDIRKPEVDMYERVYGPVMGLPEPITLPDDPKYRFEGGDAYVHNGFVYVGVGFRTSMEAAEYIYSQLRGELEQQDLRFAAVVDERFDQQQFDEYMSGAMNEETLERFEKDMEAMHLDTYSNPIGERAILVSTEDATKRRVEILDTDSAGHVVRTPQGQFVDFLQARGEDIVFLPKEDQMDFGCNFLAVNGDTILAPMENATLRRELEARGKTLAVVPLFESTRGYGASHCMTGQLHRERPSA